MSNQEIINALPDDLKAKVSDRMFLRRNGKNKYLDAATVEDAIELIKAKVNKPAKKASTTPKKPRTDYFKCLQTLVEGASKKKMNVHEFIDDLHKKNAMKINKDIEEQIQKMKEQIDILNLQKVVIQ